MSKALKASTVVGQKNGKDLTVGQIKKNPLNLAYINEFNEELCLLALTHSSINNREKVILLIPQLYQTDDFWIKAIQKNYHILENVPQQTTEICLAAIEATSYWSLDELYSYIKEPDDVIYRALIQKNGKLIKYAHRQTSELCLLAVQQSGYALEYITEPDENLFLIAVQTNGSALAYIPEQNTLLCLAAVKQSGEALRWVKQQTPEICLAAVQTQGLSLSYVKEQTYNICFAAVQQNGLALSYVKEQTYNICFAAVQQNGLALKYAQQQDFEICLAAVQQNGLALKYVQQQDFEICLAAIQQNGLALKDLKNQTYDLCYAAIQNNAEAYNYIRDEELKLKLPKKISKSTQITKKSSHISFDLSKFKKSRIVQPDNYIQQKLDPIKTLETIHQSWWQNRYQEDSFWLNWIDGLNGKNIQIEPRTFVAYHQAFFEESQVFKLDEFNLYHYIRLKPLFDKMLTDKNIKRTLPSRYYRSFFKITWETHLPYIELIKGLHVADIDIYFLIDQLSLIYPEVNDAFILNHLMNSSESSIATQILIRTKNFEQFMINNFDLLANNIKHLISEVNFRKNFIKFCSKIPHIDIYIQQLIQTYKTKNILIDLIIWLSDFPTSSNQEYLIQLLKKGKDGSLNYIIVTFLSKIGTNISDYLNPEYLLLEANKVISKYKKNEIAFLDLNQLPELKWKKSKDIINPKIIHSWLILSLDTVQNISRELLYKYIELLDDDSKIKIANYIFQQFEQNLKINNSPLLRYNGLLIFIKFVSKNKIIELIEYMKSLLWSNNRALINQQRIFIAAKLHHLKFDDMEQYDFEVLKQQYLIDIKEIQQNF
ncbi:DUF4116 domain-containing protein [Acinetobacter sp. WA-87]|uniref:DUF4116 domain-containing protein n=1 Tax=Acinetobacter sp. WA-87 TaxID=3153556 RepID=UPI00326549D8